MILESALAYLHLVAILSWVVFATSAAVLARADVFSAAVLPRLARVDQISLAAGLATLATGVARVVWGVKGASWYAAQPLLWAKVALLLAMIGSSLAATRQIARWRRDHARDGRLPDASALASVRWRLMWTSHLMVAPPLAGVLLARGVGVV